MQSSRQPHESSPRAVAAVAAQPLADEAATSLAARMVGRQEQSQAIPRSYHCAEGALVDSGLASAGSFPSGGGALQLSSGNKLLIDATINIKGREGHAEEFVASVANYIGGGGAGGGLLLEAPNVEFRPYARIEAGGNTNGDVRDANDDLRARPGAGATATSAASDGGSVTAIAGDLTFHAGGGGGGLGRLRVNTGDGNYTKASSTVEDAAVTTGIVQTR